MWLARPGLTVEEPVPQRPKTQAQVAKPLNTSPKPLKLHRLEATKQREDSGRRVSSSAKGWRGSCLQGLRIPEKGQGQQTVLAFLFLWVLFLKEGACWLDMRGIWF